MATIRSEALALAAVVAAGWGASPTVAQACSYEPYTPALQAPARDATDVPLNPMLWVPHDWSVEDDFGQEPLLDEFILLASDGTEVGLEFTELGRFGFRLLTPIEELLPRTEYTVVRCHADACDVPLRSFTTGDTRDDEAPALPVEVGARVDGSDRAPCGGRIRWVELDIEAEGVLVVDLGIPQFDVATLSGAPDIATTERPLIIDDDDLFLSDVEEIRVGAFDQAGNFSGWQALDPIDLSGCGCRAEPSSAVPAWIVLVLACRRRRRADERERIDGGARPRRSRVLRRARDRRPGARRLC